ncbi:DUF6930 domain-containing protein [Leptolyngbya sp. AN02str]|uniref:DUF6930 domain-containing protein n=1 Tax=Leptolyngbya sp. AN02str TaxID=3423363 RepID=UPI003D320EC2
MSGLTPSTRRRLQQLPKLPNVWEGDRRSLGSDTLSTSSDATTEEDCILWIDGVDESVRAMDMVPSNSGPEVVVRTLLRAMETPSGPQAMPARPNKIVVRDREIQFFLRGVLQELDISVDYVPELPLIDEVYRSLQEFVSRRQAKLPAAFAEGLQAIALDIWNDAAWDQLDEEKIFSIELNLGESMTLYASVLGLLGMEYGILLYRSLESLKSFRQQILLSEDVPEQLERAFLQQDCFFLTFDQSAVQSNGHISDDDSAIHPSYGSLHPLEGMRMVLYDEEAIAVLLTLTALHKFFQEHLNDLDMNHFPALTQRYRLPNPAQPGKRVGVTVSTLPDVADELAQITADLPDELFEDLDLGVVPILRDDLIPGDAFYSLGAMPLSVLEPLRESVKVHQPALADLPKKLDWFPVVLIQASRPKAMALIAGLQEAGGLEAICFNPGEDPFSEAQYDLGILKTYNGELHLFGEFDDQDPVHIEARKKWDQRCKKTKGQCGLVIAKGFTGSSRGNPQPKDILALFEVKSLSPQELGLGPLELVRQDE